MIVIIIYTIYTTKNYQDSYVWVCDHDKLSTLQRTLKEKYKKIK